MRERRYHQRRTHSPRGASLEERLVPVNALLGLCTPNDINPAVLANAGFRVVGLEITVACPSGGKVTIDVVLFNESESHLVFCECKAGNNIENEQAARYGTIDPKSVVTAAAITLGNKSPLTSDVLYVCLADKSERIIQGLGEISAEYPLLAVSDSEITLRRPGMASKILRNAFPSGEVKLPAPPARIIDFDHDSPVQMFVDKARPYLIRAAARRVDEVSVPRIAEDLCVHYRRYQLAVRLQIAKRFQSALRQLSVEDPDTYRYEQSPGGGPEGVVRLLRTPEDFDHRGRTAAYQSLARVSRRRRGRPVDPNQLDLLADVEGASETEGPSESSDDEEEGLEGEETS
ncbi:hypothetical protein ACLQ16_03760 [Streptomyces albidoflavus]|uniref:hypothetical protein n=1 Tax=Streptomyces albidoflavus TaxID=1886 RepID=UPI0015C4E191|nr:hypothetical protein [Streptomyces albidoflavus]